MKAALHANFIKLTTLPLNWAAGIGALLWAGLLGWVAAANSRSTPAEPAALLPILLPLLPACVVVATATILGTEFGPVLRSTLAATPDRRVLTTARAVSTGAVAGLLSVGSAVAAWSAARLAGHMVGRGFALRLALYLLVCAALAGLLTDATRSLPRGALLTLGALWIAPVAMNAFRPQWRGLLPMHDVAARLFSSSAALPWATIACLVLAGGWAVLSWRRDP
ncbi:MAG: hypothetical protein Q3999_01155 [Buchananella hordeovulneris]|nr:hypothetical protein [Buchananella hordeovulneris]